MKNMSTDFFYLFDVCIVIFNTSQFLNNVCIGFLSLICKLDIIEVRKDDLHRTGIGKHNEITHMSMSKWNNALTKRSFGGIVMSKRNNIKREGDFMEFNERDYEFMLKVKEAYENSRDGENGSIRAVAAQFDLSRTKVRKILITLGVIESDITEKALVLKESGMGLKQIADELCCSMSTVSTYLPYDTVIYNGEERSSGAIRHEKYRMRNKLAADKQVQKNEKTRKEWKEDMEKQEFKVVRLKLELNIDGADMDVLKKYGRVKEGITREVLVPADISLHALNYVIQKAFGWQNSHLHHFSLPDGKFNNLTQNSFIKWADYCGIYFRFPSDDFEDLYWDDDYDESVSVKTWLRRKYTGSYQYHGCSEHFMEAKSAVSDFIAENGSMRVPPSFAEWMNMSKEEREEIQAHPRVKKITDITCDEMREYFAGMGGLDELLERLKVTEILGKEASADSLRLLVENANRRFEVNDTAVFNEYSCRQNMSRLDGTALPLTDELFYEYDYGDGWEVRIKLEDEYCSDDAWDDTDKDGELIEGELCDQIKAVITKRRPLCIALDGLPVLDDVGGIRGYCEMLTGLHGEGSEHFGYDDPEVTKEWARMQGWTGRMNKPDKLL